MNPFHQKNFQYLKNAYLADNLHHSYIFYGEEGSGKFDFALYIARFLQCENNSAGVPCEKCKSCKVSHDGFITNTYILNKENNESVTIGDIREMQKREKLSVATGCKKVFIINSAQNLTREASEALLKTLEEPSKKSIIILITEEKKYLPKTILSRCHRVFFAGGAPNIDDLEEDKLKDIVDQLGVLIGENGFKKMILAYELANEVEIKGIVGGWILVLYSAYLTMNSNLTPNNNTRLIIESLGKKLSYDKILKVLEKANNLLDILDTNVSKRVLLEDFVLQI